MKLRADEHVSKFIVKAVREIALSPGWEFTSIHEVGDTGTADVHWITKFADEDGDGIISADRDFLSLEPQVNAVFDTGLRVIHMPPKWGHQKGHLQAAHILQWWGNIEDTLSTMKPRECYRPTWNIRGADMLVMKKITIDFAKAQKKRKKARKRTN